MEEYKSNSRKAKEGNDISEKKVEKAIIGSAKVKKRTEVQKFADVFISEDVENVKSYIIMEVLIPAVKKAISDIVVNGIDMILYGETGHTKKVSSGVKPSYRSYYDSKRDDRSVASGHIKSSYSFDNVILDTYGDADSVLDRMIEIVDTYGTVSVADMYDLAGISGFDYTSNKYGWTDLRMASIERVREGGYTIKLPKVLPLN